MPRPLRLDYPGARHHVFNRGARREPVFFRDMHCALFLDLLAELPERHGVRIHGFTLMPNHYHLMIETPRGNLSDAMGRLSSIYTQRINRERGWDGALFRGRFKNKLVHSEDHWIHLLAYIHLNPVRAGLCTRASEYNWSSHGEYGGEDRPPDWLTTDELAEAFGSRRGYVGYLDDVVKRRLRPPDEFDRVLFERPGSAVHLAENKNPELRMSVGEALADVMKVTGSSRKELMTTRRGRRGNPARAMATYWLVMGAGATGAQTARELGMTRANVSMTVERVRNLALRDATFMEWTDKLLSLLEKKS